MSDVLTPPLALEYLAELQPALVHAEILDAGGAVLARIAPRAAAGAGAGAARAEATRAAAARAEATREVATRGGFSVRAAGAGATLAPVLQIDLESVLDALTGVAPEAATG